MLCVRLIVGVPFLIITSAVLPYIQGQCLRVIRTSEYRDGYINFTSARNVNCTWSLSRGWRLDNILTLELRSISMTAESLPDSNTITGILKLPEVGGITSLGPRNCYVYMLSTSECDIPATKERIKSGTGSCDKQLLISELDHLPWKHSVSLQSFMIAQKSFKLFYKYDKCVPIGGEKTPDSRTKGTNKRPNPSPGKQNASYPVAVAILSVLLFISIGVILWTVVTQKKLAATYFNKRDDNTTRSPPPGVDGRQNLDTAAYHYAEESSATQQDPSPAYAEISGNTFNAGAGSLQKGDTETCSFTDQPLPPVYATVQKGGKDIHHFQ